MSTFSIYSIIGILLGLGQLLLWLAVACASVIAFVRERQSAVVLQGIGAIGMCLGTGTQTLVFRLLPNLIIRSGSSNWQLLSTALGVLGFLAMTVFAAGYCMEKFSRRSNMMPSAFPVSDVETPT